MARKVTLKVYAGNTFVKGKQVYAFVAATSWNKAAAAFKESVHYMRVYWSSSVGNEVICKIALANPDKPFYLVGDVSATPAEENVREYLK